MKTDESRKAFQRLMADYATLSGNDYFKLDDRKEIKLHTGIPSMGWKGRPWKGSTSSKVSSISSFYDCSEIRANGVLAAHLQ